MKKLPDRPFFILFLFLGFNLDKDKNSTMLKIVSMIMKLKMTIIFIIECISLILFAHEVSQTVNQWQQIIFAASILIKDIIISSSLVVFQLNLKNIQRILLDLSQILTENEKRKIWIFQIICLFVWVVLTTVNSYIEITVKLDNSFLVILELAWSYNVFGWYIATQMFSDQHLLLHSFGPKSYHI